MIPFEYYIYASIVGVVAGIAGTLFFLWANAEDVPDEPPDERLLKRLKRSTFFLLITLNDVPDVYKGQINQTINRNYKLLNEFDEDKS